MTTDSNDGSHRGKAKLLALIPKEHRLPGLLFFVVQAVLVAIASGSGESVEISAIVGIVVVAGIFLIRFFPHRPEKSQSHLKASIGPWIESIIEAKKRVQMLGINFLGSLHDTREHLIALLNAGGEVQILLLSTESDAFKEREVSEGQHKNGTFSGRLRAEASTALEIIKDINLFSKAGNLEFRTYDESPTSSILIVDNEFVLYNPYPKGKDRTDQAEVLVSRGKEGGIDKYCLGDGLFDQKVDEFTHLWDTARPLDLSIEN